jgi:hypothetical protein
MGMLESRRGMLESSYQSSSDRIVDEIDRARAQE